MIIRPRFVELSGSTLKVRIKSDAANFDDGRMNMVACLADIHITSLD